VYVVLCSLADRDGVASPSVGTIAEKAGVSDRTVIRSLQRLEALGFVTIERRDHETSVYKLRHRAEGV
jgi:DNA-binding MurR/RpiR family transcriptional regulator